MPNFNDLPEDQQIQEMEKSSPRHSNQNSVAQLVPTKSDMEYAKELKEKLVVIIMPVLELVTQANKDGFEVQFGIGKDALGKQVITALKVMREY